MAHAHGCPLIGGDTVVSPGPLTLSVTAFGSVPDGQMVRRNGAQPGDLLFVTGHIGDAAIGLQLRLAERAGGHWPLAGDHLAYLTDRYLLPRPRTAVAGALRRHASAAMDISDGFVGDLTKMLALAGAGADVQLDEVPHSVAARAAIRARSRSARGGADGRRRLRDPRQRAGRRGEGLRRGLPRGGRAGGAGWSRDPQGAPLRFLDVEGRERRFARGSYVHGAA